MHDKSLHSLLRVRQQGRDDAQMRLARGIKVEAEAAAKVDAVERTIATEQEVASQVDSDDAAVEAFAAWLPTAKAQAEAALEAQAKAEAEVALARAVLTASRQAVETVETLIMHRDRERKTRRDREDSRALDEAYRAPPP